MPKCISKMREGTREKQNKIHNILDNCKMLSWMILKPLWKFTDKCNEHCTTLWLNQHAQTYISLSLSLSLHQRAHTHTYSLSLPLSPAPPPHSLSLSEVLISIQICANHKQTHIKHTSEIFPAPCLLNSTRAHDAWARRRERGRRKKSQIISFKSNHFIQTIRLQSNKYNHRQKKDTNYTKRTQRYNLYNRKKSL